MYPPKVKPHAQEFNGGAHYLGDARKAELMAMKKELDSKSPKVLIRQLYADSQAATLRALATSQKHSSISSTRTPKASLASSPTAPSSAEGFDSSFEATAARILANEKKHDLQSSDEDKSLQTSQSGETPLQRMHTAEFLEEFKGIDWANISAYKAYEFGQVLQREQTEAHKKQRALLEDLTQQIDEHEAARRKQREDKFACCQVMANDRQEWEREEKEKARHAREKVERDREEVERALEMRALQKQEEKAQKQKEDKQLIRRTVKEMERERKRDIRQKLKKRDLVREMMKASQEEQRKAQLREAEEKREDLILLQESIRLEEEAEARRIVERQRQIDAHQCRADRIAEALKDDKVEKATRNAIARHEKEQADMDRRDLILKMEKLETVKRNAAYLKAQAAEKEAKKLAEAQERRKLQMEQENDAVAYLAMVEEKERQKRAENKKQQELLLQQIEEQKRRTDLCVSATELKMNKALLAKVKIFKQEQQQQAPQRSLNSSDSEENGD